MRRRRRRCASCCSACATVAPTLCCHAARVLLSLAGWHERPAFSQVPREARARHVPFHEASTETIRELLRAAAGLATAGLAASASTFAAAGLYTATAQPSAALASPVRRSTTVAATTLLHHRLHAAHMHRRLRHRRLLAAVASPPPSPPRHVNLLARSFTVKPYAVYGPDRPRLHTQTQ